MNRKKTQKKDTPATILTFTFPHSNEAQRTGTLVARRGSLATIREFTFTNVAEIGGVIREAAVALNRLEFDLPSNPPGHSAEQPQISPPDQSLPVQEVDEVAEELPDPDPEQSNQEDVPMSSAEDDEYWADRADQYETNQVQQAMF